MCVTDLQRNTNGNSSCQTSSDSTRTMSSSNHITSISKSTTNSSTSSDSPATSQLNVISSSIVTDTMDPEHGLTFSTIQPISAKSKTTNFSLKDSYSPCNNPDLLLNSPRLNQMQCSEIVREISRGSDHYTYGNLKPQFQSTQSSHSVNLKADCQPPTSSIPPQSHKLSLSRLDTYGCEHLSTTTLRDIRLNPTHVDSGSLLLLANCATLSTFTPGNEPREYHPSRLRLSEPSSAISDPHVSSFLYGRSVQQWHRCTTVSGRVTTDNDHQPGLWCEQSGSMADQSSASKLYDLSKQQQLNSVAEFGEQRALTSCPLQTPVLSEEHLQFHDTFTNC